MPRARAPDVDEVVAGAVVGDELQLRVAVDNRGVDGFGHDGERLDAVVA